MASTAYLAGIASAYINGAQVMLVGNLTYQTANIEAESAVGMDGVQGPMAKYVAPFVAFRVRLTSDQPVSNYGRDDWRHHRDQPGERVDRVRVRYVDHQGRRGRWRRSRRRSAFRGNLRERGRLIMETMTITLRKALTDGEDRITKLELREPTAGEARDAGKLDGLDANIALVAAVSGLRKPLIERLPQREFLKALRFFQPFLNDGLLRHEAQAETYEMKLTRAVIRGDGETVQYLNLSEPTAGYLRNVEKQGGIDRMIALVAFVASESPAVIAKANVSDVLRAYAYLDSFTDAPDQNSTI